MAAALLRKGLSTDDGPEVLSAGIAAVRGACAEPEARKTMQRRGLDISAHRARQVAYDALAGADLVLVMGPAQEAWLGERYPMLRGRVYQLGRWRGIEIPDPYGSAQCEFERVCALMEACFTEWLKWLKPLRAAQDNYGTKP